MPGHSCQSAPGLGANRESLARSGMKKRSLSGSGAPAPSCDAGVRLLSESIAASATRLAARPDEAGWPCSAQPGHAAAPVARMGVPLPVRHLKGGALHRAERARLRGVLTLRSRTAAQRHPSHPAYAATRFGAASCPRALSTAPD